MGSRRLFLVVKHQINASEYFMLVIHKNGLIHNAQFCLGLQDQTQYLKSFWYICTKPLQESIQTVSVHIPGQFDTFQTKIEHKKQHLYKHGSA